MFSIVVMQHKHNNGNITTVMGIRLDGSYEDSRNVKAYLTLKSAQDAFESKVKNIKQEIKQG